MRHQIRLARRESWREGLSALQYVRKGVAVSRGQIGNGRLPFVRMWRLVRGVGILDAENLPEMRQRNRKPRNQRNGCGGRKRVETVC